MVVAYFIISTIIYKSLINIDLIYVIIKAKRTTI